MNQQQSEVKPKNNRKILYGAIAIFICCICLVIGAVANQSNSDTTQTEPQPQSADQENQSSAPETAPTSAPPPTAAPELGTSRDNPIPGAAGVSLSGDLNLTILEVNRDASSIVIGGNMFNATPSPTQSYITVKIQVECGKPSDQTCSFIPSDIKAVGSDGNIQENDLFVSGVPETFTEFSYDFFGGAATSGNLIYLLQKDDPKIVLFYEQFLADTIYIGLP